MTSNIQYPKLNAMRRIFLLLFFISSSSLLFGQNSEVNIRFKPSFNSITLVPSRKYYCEAQKDSISINLLTFYIADIEFLQNDVVVAKENNSYHLVNILDSNSLNIKCKLAKPVTYNKIRFHLGIDSLTNTGGAMGGELDPTKGMYWTWQSGYINLKMEGEANQSTARNHEYQFHLGGYASPNYSMQTIETSVSNSSLIEFEIKTELFFSGINLATENHIMSPCEKAVDLSRKAASMFVLIK